MTPDPALTAPFPYFGGKSRIAEMVWQRFGRVQNYVEPFAGSLAVLLARPGGAHGTETVNDIDAYLANFWRALAGSPGDVAHHADWPVNEVDLTARHAWLVRNKPELSDALLADPEWYDAKAAGWWVWGISCWIGGHWCAGNGPWQSDGTRLVKVGGGVRRQLPRLGDGMVKVHERHLEGYLRKLSGRLRRVRVCSGDWSRVTGPSVTHHQGSVLAAVFLDPPYSVTDRSDCYAHETRGLAAEILEYCKAEQDNHKMRIALCGYDGEYDLPGWDRVKWEAHGGYARLATTKPMNENARRERIWFSPHCLGKRQKELF